MAHDARSGEVRDELEPLAARQEGLDEDDEWEEDGLDEDDDPDDEWEDEDEEDEDDDWEEWEEELEEEWDDEDEDRRPGRFRDRD